MKRKPEKEMNIFLDIAITDAKDGELRQARHLYNMLYKMLNETEESSGQWCSGQWWLTDHGRKVLSDVLIGLMDSENKTHVLESVNFHFSHGRKRRFADSWRDVQIHEAVATEISKQKGKPNIADAVKKAKKNIRENIDPKLGESRIRAIFTAHETRLKSLPWNP